MFKKILIIFLSILYVNSLVAEDHSRDKEQFFAIINKIVEESEKRSAIAIEYLKEYPYADVGPIVVELLHHELNHRKNKEVIEQLIEVLRYVGDRSLVLPDNALTSGESILIDFMYRLKQNMASDTKHFRPVRARQINQHLQETMDALKKISPIKDRLFAEEEKVNLESILAELKGQESPESSAVEEQVEGSLLEKRLNKYVALEKKLISKVGKDFGKKEIKAGDASPYEILLAGTNRYITDDVVDSLRKDDHFRIYGRDAESLQVFLTLARHKQNNAILVGPAGAGKTSVVDGVAYSIVVGELEANPVMEFLKDAHIIQTSAGNISRLAKSDKPSAQAYAIEEYFKSLRIVQEELKTRIIIFIDEVHTLSPEQVEAIKPYIESSRSQILFIGASTSQEFRSAFKHNGAFLRRVDEIPISQFSVAQVFDIYKASWEKIIKRRHPNIEISDENVQKMIRYSDVVFPEKGITDGSFVFIDHLAGKVRFNNPNGKTVEISSKDIFNFIQEKTRLPVNPKDFLAREAYRLKLLEGISNKVKFQDRAIRDVVDTWMELITSESSRRIRIVLMRGTSGTGKSRIAEVLAEVALGSKDRSLTIQGPAYADANDIKMGTIFGVPGGVTFSKVSGGMLIEFLDDPSKGKYGGIYIVDEIEKANELFALQHMEMFDTGYTQGGDGKLRKINNLLVVLTTNFNDRQLFPEDFLRKSNPEKIIDYVEKMDTETLRKDLEEFLPDSLVNRIDKVTVTSSIHEEMAKEIVREVILPKIFSEFEETKIKISYEERVIDYFIQVNNPLMRGVRPLERDLTAYLRNAISSALASEFKDGDKMHIDIVKAEKDKSMLSVTINKKTTQTDLPYVKAFQCEAVFKN